MLQARVKTTRFPPMADSQQDVCSERHFVEGEAAPILNYKIRNSLFFTPMFQYCPPVSVLLAVYCDYNCL